MRHYSVKQGNLGTTAFCGSSLKRGLLIENSGQDEDAVMMDAGGNAEDFQADDEMFEITTARLLARSARRLKKATSSSGGGQDDSADETALDDEEQIKICGS